MSKLLPCPFCGGCASYGESDDGGWFIACTSKECQASTNLVYPLKDDVRAVLAEKWNSRPAPAPAIDVEGVANSVMTALGGWRHDFSSNEDSERGVVVAAIRAALGGKEPTDTALGGRDA